MSFPGKTHSSTHAGFLKGLPLLGLVKDGGREGDSSAFYTRSGRMALICLSLGGRAGDEGEPIAAVS